MMFLFADLIKGSPGVQSVHATTAIGNGTRRRRRRLVFPAFIGQTNVTKFSRALTPLDAERSHVPFTYDPTALAGLRPDQMPRFLGAITNPDDLPVQTVSLDHLTAIQNRVDTAKVQAWADGTIKSDKLAVVVRDGDRQLIADGHHRLAGAWLRGETTAKVRVKDLTPVSQAVKRDLDWSLPLDIRKADPDLRQVFGWASVVEKNGVLVIDKQDDMIPVSSLEPAVYDFVLNSREQDDLHTSQVTGRMIESMVFTKEKQAALGIDLGMVGWWAGWHVDSDPLWAAYKRGERPEFSIGGQAVSREV